MLVVKNPPANAEDIRDTGLIPGLGRSPGEGNGNLLQYSRLGSPMDRGAWRATVHGVSEELDTILRLNNNQKRTFSAPPPTPQFYFSLFNLYLGKSSWSCFWPHNVRSTSYTVMALGQGFLNMIVQDNHLEVCENRFQSFGFNGAGQGPGTCIPMLPGDEMLLLWDHALRTTHLGLEESGQHSLDLCRVLSFANRVLDALSCSFLPTALTILSNPVARGVDGGSQCHTEEAPDSIPHSQPAFPG